MPAVKNSFFAEHEGGTVSSEYDEAGLNNGTLVSFFPGYESSAAMQATVTEKDGYARGIAKLAKTGWEHGEEVWWGGAIYLPVGFYAAKQGQIDMLRWDNFEQDAVETERCGIVMQTTDKKFRLVRIKETKEQKTLNLSGESVIGPEIKEGEWNFIDVRQVLSKTDGGGVNELWINGALVASSTVKNCSRSDLIVSRYRAGIAATNGAQTNDISVIVDDVYSGPERKGKLAIEAPNINTNVRQSTPWTMVLTKLDGTELNEVRMATARKLVMSLNKPSTASFTVRPDNPVLAPLFGEDTLLKVYEDTTLRFHGNVISSELATQEDGSAPTVQVNAADPAWRLSRRLLGLSSGGTEYKEIDKAKAARKMINELNTDTATYPTNPHTGIKLLAESEYSAGGTGTYTAGPYKSALGCINDLAHGFDGFDWYMAPIDGETATISEFTTPLIALFEAEAVYGGSSGAVFEHGYGQKNVRKLSYLRDLGGLANKAVHLPDEGLTEGEVKTATDPDSFKYRGRYEVVADGFGLVDSTLRQDWVDEVVRVRKNPRFVVGMTLDVDDHTGRVPQIGEDFWLGDLVQARSVIADATMFNGQVRVYQIQVDINNNGGGTVTPVLIDEEGSEL